VEAKNGRNPLVEAAQAIDIFGGAERERERELDAVRGEMVAADWRDDPRFAPVPADPDTGQEASNTPGSFESFMRNFDPEGAHLQAVPDLPDEEGG
jgi:hypothetical protein